MADTPTPTPEPVSQAEPVAIADIVKLLIFAAGYAGLQVPEDTATKVVAGVVALFAFVQATWFTRKGVTPESRAVAREEQAYRDGLAVGQTPGPETTPQATVVQVAGNPDVSRIVDALKTQGVDIADTDVEAVAPPAPPGPPPAPTRLPPPAGLD